MELLDNIEAGFSSAVTRLQNSASQFASAYNAFVNIPAQYRTENWQTVKNQADSVKSTISMFTGAIDTAYGWLRSAFGLSGMGQLGIVIPAVPWLTVAAVGAAVSAIMVTYSYMVEELNKSAYKKELMDADKVRIEQGLPPLYSDTVLTSQNLFTDTASAIKWLAVGAAALFIVPKLLEQIKRGK